MSASTTHPNDHQRDANVRIGLLDKWVTVERALSLVPEGVLKPGDITVLVYMASSIDSETGLCIRYYKKIASSCGISRATAVRAVARLKASGLIEAQCRYAQTSKRKLSTAFKLVIHTEASVGPRASRPPVQERASNSSHVYIYPSGKQSIERSGSVDWSEHVDWLTKAGRYHDAWGFGAESLAAEDLQRLREEKGDGQLLRVIGIAREKRLYGPVLRNFLKHTWPHQRQRFDGSRDRLPREGG